MINLEYGRREQRVTGWWHGRRRPAERFATRVDDGPEDELVRLVGRLRGAVPPVPVVPDADFRLRLRTTVTAMATHRRGRTRRPVTIGLAAAAAALLVGTGVVALTGHGSTIQLQAESLTAYLPMSPLASGQARLRLASTKLRALSEVADADSVAAGLSSVDAATKAAARLLAAAALARGDRAPLDALDGFVVGQLAGLSALEQTGQVGRSRTLVLRLGQRSRELRRSVACPYGYAGPAGSDDLGGRPPACAASPG